MNSLFIVEPSKINNNTVLKDPSDFLSDTKTKETLLSLIRFYSIQWLFV